MRKICVYLSLIALIIIATPHGHAQSETGDSKAILVTGATSGIGRNITETLAGNGYFVYAGARKQSDMDELNKIENVQAVRLDVTVQGEIDNAVETIRNGGHGLYGLVNNAGVAFGAPLIEADEEDMQWLFDVNVFGVYRVTRAFAPLLIESKGRIINIGSISGILSGPLFGPYSMTKHAVEAYTDALAQEMTRFGVSVSVIEPGNYKSDIGLTAVSRMQDSNIASDDSLYAEELQQFLNRPADRSQYKEPDEVAAAAMHALFDENPKPRYMVVPNRQEAAITINRSIQKTIELNSQQQYEFSREELVEMLDTALSPGTR